MPHHARKTAHCELHIRVQLPAAVGAPHHERRPQGPQLPALHAGRAPGRDAGRVGSAAGAGCVRRREGGGILPGRGVTRIRPLFRAEDGQWGSRSDVNAAAATTERQDPLSDNPRVYPLTTPDGNLRDTAPGFDGLSTGFGMNRQRAAHTFDAAGERIPVIAATGQRS